MEDTFKPAMLEPSILAASIDLEPLKPSKATEAAAYCATVVSNIEGWRLVPLPATSEGRRASVERLDARVRHLEDMSAISPPPPMDTPSWDSLMWRAARLHHKMPATPPSPPGMNRLPESPPHITPTLALLRSIVASAGGAAGPQSWAALTERDGVLQGDELVRAAAQFLAHTAGRHGFRLVGSFRLEETCRLALDLSLRAAGPGSGPMPGPRGPMVPRPGAPVHLRKACCGCCSCFCHNRNAVKVSPNPGVVRWMTRKYHKERRESRTGVKARIAHAFGKLAFWRRDRGQDTDSDASSISTRSSSTFA